MRANEPACLGCCANAAHGTGTVCKAAATGALAHLFKGLSTKLCTESVESYTPRFTCPIKTKN